MRMDRERGREAERQYRARRSGLALMEVVIVAGCIGLPSALLVPVVTQRGRTDAHLGQCLSNLRQIGTAMGMYFQETNDWFPWEKNNNLGQMFGMNLTGFYYGGHPGRNVGDGMWWGYVIPDYRDTPGGKPLNKYIYPGLPKIDIPPGDPRYELVRDVPVFFCPSDTGAVFNVDPNWEPPPGTPTAYDECGTSYDCNYNFCNTWANYTALCPLVGGRSVWMNYANAFLRVQLRRNASSFVTAYEDPFDVSVNMLIARRGWHGEMNRHNLMFADGHAAYTFTDTAHAIRGPGWKWCGKPSVSGGGNVDLWAWFDYAGNPDFRYRKLNPVP